METESVLHAHAKLKANRIEFHFFEHKAGDSQGVGGLQKSFPTQDGEMLVEYLRAD